MIKQCKKLEESQIESKNLKLKEMKQRLTDISYRTFLHKFELGLEQSLNSVEFFCSCKQITSFKQGKPYFKNNPFVFKKDI